MVRLKIFFEDLDVSAKLKVLRIFQKLDFSSKNSVFSSILDNIDADFVNFSI